MNRFQTLGLLLDHSHKFVLRFVVKRLSVGAKARRRAKDRGKWRAQVVRNRGQHRIAKPLSLGGKARAVDVADEIDALNGERRLIGQRRRGVGADQVTRSDRSYRYRGR